MRRNRSNGADTACRGGCSASTTPYVPLLVVVAMVLGDLIRPHGGRDWLVLSISDAWFSIGPAVALVALGAQTPAWAHWPAYVLAFGVQYVVDSAPSSPRCSPSSAIPAGRSRSASPSPRLSL